MSNRYNYGRGIATSVLLYLNLPYSRTLEDIIGYGILINKIILSSLPKYLQQLKYPQYSYLALLTKEKYIGGGGVQGLKSCFLSNNRV